jgi:type II secretory pathway pseudopilin PulG
MQRGLKSKTSRMASKHNPQRGYILISLMLMFALMAIAALAVLPNMVQQIKRDREEEMCRRGTQYMRAIQHYYRKLNRYPTKVEDLENTNNMRFLRRRYKDPLMKDAQGHDKDFKFLHIQDVMLNNGPVLGGAAGMSALSGMMGQAGALGQGGAGGLQALAGALGQGGAGGLQALAGAAGAQGMAGAQGLAALQAQAGQLGAMGGQSTTLNLNGSSDSQSGSQGNSDSSNGSSSSSGPNGSISASGSGLSGQTFGGGPILGVASTSKEKTIREYNKKNHYNDWYFVYDQSLDRGGLLVGPWQPLAITGTSNIGTPVGQMNQGQGSSQNGSGGFGQQGGLGQSGGGFGQSGGFGNSGGLGQSQQNQPTQNNGTSPQN